MAVESRGCVEQGGKLVTSVIFTPGDKGHDDPQMTAQQVAYFDPTRAARAMNTAILDLDG